MADMTFTKAQISKGTRALRKIENGVEATIDGRREFGLFFLEIKGVASLRVFVEALNRVVPEHQVSKSTLDRMIKVATLSEAKFNKARKAGIEARSTAVFETVAGLTASRGGGSKGGKVKPADAAVGVADRYGKTYSTKAERRAFLKELSVRWDLV
jgi:hypothetical protein